MTEQKFAKKIGKQFSKEKLIWCPYCNGKDLPGGWFKYLKNIKDVDEHWLKCSRCEMILKITVVQGVELESRV